MQSAKEEEEEKAEDKKADEDKNEEDVAEPAVEAAVEASQPAPAQGTTYFNKNSHKSPIYDEGQTQSAKILSLS